MANDSTGSPRKPTALGLLPWALARAWRRDIGRHGPEAKWTRQSTRTSGRWRFKDIWRICKHGYSAYSPKSCFSEMNWAVSTRRRSEKMYVTCWAMSGDCSQLSIYVTGNGPSPRQVLVELYLDLQLNWCDFTSLTSTFGGQMQISTRKWNKQRMMFVWNSSKWAVHQPIGNPIGTQEDPICLRPLGS